MGEWVDRAAVGDGDGAVVSVRVIVDGLLVVLELDAGQSEPESPHRRGYYTLFMSGNRSTWCDQRPEKLRKRDSHLGKSSPRS